MTWFGLLDPIQPVLSGRWWWVGALAAAVAAWLVLRESVPALRRSADARCRRCGHPFPPGSRFDAEPRPRCSECGAETRSSRDAHVRPMRPWRLAASILLLTAVVLPAPPALAATCTIDGVSYTITISGTNSAETINGTASGDVIDPKGGDDVVNARGGNDKVCPSDGYYEICGNAGVDRIEGGYGPRG